MNPIKRPFLLVFDDQFELRAPFLRAALKENVALRYEGPSTRENLGAHLVARFLSPAVAISDRPVAILVDLAVDELDDDWRLGIKLIENLRSAGLSDLPPIGVISSHVPTNRRATKVAQSAVRCPEYVISMEELAGLNVSPAAHAKAVRSLRQLCGLEA